MDSSITILDIEGTLSRDASARGRQLHPNPFPLWPIVVRYWESSFCVCRETRKRRTPLCGARTHVLPQPGHSTCKTPLSSKRWREIRTAPETVHLSGAATSDTAFFRDRARGACSVGAEERI